MGHGITSRDSMFSVREVPWHGLGVVLDEAPASIDDALIKAGLKWDVGQKQVYLPNYELTDEGVKTTFAPAAGWMANVREDTGEVLGVVTDDYKVVNNEDAFRFLDAVIGSDLHFETAGSIQAGRRVWVLCRLPEWIEVAGDAVGTYVYVANSHDGSMAVTSAVTPIRIRCQNTLGAALSRSEHGQAAQRTFRFRHTGDLVTKFDEARKVMGLTLNYERQFKVLGDRLAQERMTKGQFERKVANVLFPIDRDKMGKRAITNRLNSREKMADIFAGNGPAGDTRGNSPDTKWTAWNAVGEYADHCRRYTKRTNQVQRSFEDTDLKQRGLDLVVAA